jgi:hypothetical protein
MTQPNNLGAPPGTLCYMGPFTQAPVKITLIEFNETDFFERDFDDMEECLNARKNGSMLTVFTEQNW